MTGAALARSIMSCNPTIPCSVPLAPPPGDGLSCGACLNPQFMVCPFVYDDDDDSSLAPESVINCVPIKGHATGIWVLNHGPEPEGVEANIGMAREWLENWSSIQKTAQDLRGHFTLRSYAGHWGLEIFKARLTVPHPLAVAMARITSEATMWFLDPGRLLPEPDTSYREIGDDEVKERIDGYQKFLDKEAVRMVTHGYSVPPALRELPWGQQQWLVTHWDNLWFGFLDLHSEYRWTPSMGFWVVTETVFPLRASG